MDNAIELFAQKGYEATSIQEITKKCSISKGAFYLSFSSKEELFLAIIEHIIDKFGENVDRVVTSSVNQEHKLFLYYSNIFDFVNSHRSFAMIFISEQMQHSGQWDSMNKKLFSKLSFYDEQFSYSIISLLEQIYGEHVANTKYDLMICIKGFIKVYSEYVLLQHQPVDIIALSKSLVDKTDALAQHAKAVFLTEGDFEIFQLRHRHNMTMETIVEQLDHCLQQAEQPLELQSLQILKEQLTSPEPSEAIVQGMLYNLKQYPTSRQLLNMYQHYEYKKLYCKQP